MFVIFDKHYGEFVYQGEKLEDAIKAYKDNCDEDPDFEDVIVVEGKEVKVNVKTTYTIIQSEPAAKAPAKKPAVKK